MTTNALEPPNVLELPEGKTKRLGKLNAGDRKVRHAIPDIANYLIAKSLEGDMRAAEIVHRYYIQPMREARDAKRAARASRSTSALPASVTGALTRFSAILVKGEIAPSAIPSAIDVGPPSHATDADTRPDATSAVALDVSQSSARSEAAANPGGVETHAWDPSRPLLQEGGHANGPAFDENGMKLCERCGHPITDRKKVSRAHFCLACAEAGRKHSLAESARKQAERRAQRKLQEEHDAKGPR